MGLYAWKACPGFKLKRDSVLGHMETRHSDCRPECYKRISDRHSHGVPPLKRLPKGLVGMKCTAKVTIEEREVDSLLDTGSQVTIIPVIL